MKKDKLDLLLNILTEGLENNPDEVKRLLAEDGLDYDIVAEQGGIFVKNLIKEKIKNLNNKYPIKNIEILGHYKEDKNVIEFNIFSKLTGKFVCRFGWLEQEGFGFNFNISDFIDIKGDEEGRPIIVK